MNTIHAIDHGDVHVETEVVARDASIHSVWVRQRNDRVHQ